MTNEHIIKKEIIFSKETIYIYYDNKKDGEKEIKLKLDENERYIMYNKEMDITIIEIKDLITEKRLFFIPNNK